ncbi:MAG: hypothetical protein WAW96_02665, partial [Alphaproteobacteria bacterium]
TQKDRAMRAVGEVALAKMQTKVSAFEIARKSAPDSFAPAPETSKVSIVVLPFANMSGDQEQEYFSDGITEDIITDLSKVSALTVISRNSAFMFKGRHVDLPQVAHQLKVSHVLEGSVRKSGNRVRITAQLINGATNGHVWAERYDRDLADIFALQDEISETIVKALKLKLLPEEKKAIETRGTSNVEAYDIYLRARTLTDRMGAANLKRAIELYRHVIALDPNFQPAMGGLIQALRNYAVAAPDHRAEALAELDATYERIIQTSSHQWLTQTIRGAQRQFNRDYVGAEQLHDEAARSAPAGALIGHRAYFQEAVCRFEEAIETYRPMLRLDPLSLVVSLMFQGRLDVGGKREEAQAEYERSKDLAGDRSMIEFLAFLRLWARAKPEEITAQYQRFLSSRGPEMRATVFDQIEPVLFATEAARQLISRAAADPTNQSATRLVQLGLLAGAFGAIDAALVALRIAFVDMSFSPQRYLWLPVLVQARKDPRFKAIVRDLGLYDYWKKSGKWGDFARPLGDDDFEIVR